eukprot:8587733-Pyramimonas_sp.AAC.1
MLARSADVRASAKRRYNGRCLVANGRQRDTLRKEDIANDCFDFIGRELAIEYVTDVTDPESLNKLAGGLNPSGRRQAAIASA